ncbi:hypothetical protein JAAARDRAFT_199196 [Jaapia argillacea MUCL 33604]|uniref:Nucleoside phosphorylase domain-containing protein n=1 Tax=Jaapia argillacea MUCL 33604 TaxID=933084 RepID=A0A067P9B1_9AGAM|nr:hypothetical protein JAAARDRAFT_199196 [Jaapia argillacea MUCL 33604]
MLHLEHQVQKDIGVWRMQLTKIARRSLVELRVTAFDFGSETPRVVIRDPKLLATLPPPQSCKPIGMKDLIIDANFPRTLDQRVYHLGLRSGEVANRIITVGSPPRADAIAVHLDAQPKPFRLFSERGFLTITGRFKGVPVSICSIGMGYPNMDFFVREVRECLIGEMIVIRLGSCGGLRDFPVGSVVVPRASVAVTRNFDYDFYGGGSTKSEMPYRISKPAVADVELATILYRSLDSMLAPTRVIPGVVNASADSFYSSQGRKTLFPDHNSDLINHLLSSVDDLATLEMETFHLFHLAASWSGPPKPPIKPATNGTDGAATQSPVLDTLDLSEGDRPRIRAASAQMIFASRTSQEFIVPEEVERLESLSGRAVLQALVEVDIPGDRLHPDAGSVWT